MGLVLVIVISGYFDMIILHKDNPIYSSHGKDNYLERFIGTDRDNKYKWSHIGGLYHEKFETLFKSCGLDYKMSYYEDYPNIEGEYFFGRFAHAKSDKDIHKNIYPKLEKRFDNIWPNKITYELYDEKIKQFEWLESAGYSHLVDYEVVNSLEELYQKVKVGDVVKSSVGASSGNLFLITEPKYCEYENLYELIRECDENRLWNSNDNFFPAMIQPKYEGLVHKLFITNNYVYDKKWTQSCDTSEPLNFGVGHPDRKWINTNKTLSSYVTLKDELSQISIYNECLDIWDRLDTPNLCIDYIETDLGGKIIEFSYLYTEPIPASDFYGRYNFDKNKFENTEENMNEISYNQVSSVLKEFNLV